MAIAGAAALAALGLAGEVSPLSAPGEERFEARTVNVGWLSLRVPLSWSVTGVQGSPVVATPIAPGWAKAVSLTAAPHGLPRGLGRRKAALRIPSGSYVLWISASRTSRKSRGTSIPIRLRRGDRVAPAPGAAHQFVRRARAGDVDLLATLSLGDDADLDNALGVANRVLRTVRAD